MLITYMYLKTRRKYEITLSYGESFYLNAHMWRTFVKTVMPETVIQAESCGDTEVSEAKIEQFFREVLLPAAKQKAMNLLLLRDHSRKELYDKLTRQKYPACVITETIAYIDSYHYLDDARFAKNYIYANKHKKSKRALMYELNNKGVDIRELSDDEDLELPNDQENIKMQVIKAFGEHPHPDEKERNRLLRRLASKGYAAPDVYHVFDEFGI